MRYQRESTKPMLNDRINLQASCADAIDNESISVENARQKITAKIDPVIETDELELLDSLGRVLAEDIVSSLNVPGHTNSAMDGYALSGDDLPDESPRQYHVTGTALAGQPFKGRCHVGQCVRIMTGAAMPAGTDTVVIQEHTETVSASEVRIAGGHRKHQNVRLAGEDIREGSIVLVKGHKIHAADLGVLASTGTARIRVYRKPRVAFFSTGDELRPIGEALHTGEIHDSNRYSLHGMLGELNVDILDLGIVRDDQQSLRAAFNEASSNADIVITTGGVSVGEADLVKDIVEETGEINLWKIAMKPGRPIAFGRTGDAAFFGLPGNPVSVMTSFYQFVVPAIQRLSGQGNHTPLTFRVTCDTVLRKRPGRFEFQRGVLSMNKAGVLTVSATGKQGSGILTSMSRANCLILLDEECDGIKPGDHVTVQAFRTYL